MTTTAPPAKPKLTYPRPPVAVLPTDLFREPVYESGQPYAVDDEDEEAGTITP